MPPRVFRVETATRASDGGRVVSSAHFDAISCDVATGESGGEAFYSWLQRERRSSAQRVSFMTSGVTDEVSRSLDAPEPRFYTSRSLCRPWSARSMK
jgi:hypothetical protein